MKYCTNCGKQLPDEAKFCFVCGEAQHMPEPAAPSADIVCPACGEVNEAGARACHRCTYPLYGGAAKQGVTIQAPDDAVVTISDDPPESAGGQKEQTAAFVQAAHAAVNAVRELVRETNASETAGESVIGVWKE